MKRHLYTVLAVLPLLFSSCEKLLIKQDENASDPKKNFEFLWSYIHDRYPYFEEKKQHYGLDWDEVHSRYAAQVQDNMSDVQLFNVLAKMMNELHDGHSNLVSPYRVSFFDKQYLDTANFNWDIIVRNYLMTDTSQGTYYAKSGFAWGVLKEKIGYVRYSSFMNPVANFYPVMKYFNDEKVKGMILDIRNNGGGVVEYAQQMAGYFITSKTQVGYSIVRTAPDKWSEPLQQYIEPQKYFWNMPVVLLTSKGSFSSSNLFAEYVRPLDNVTVVGDSTGGGGALPFDYEMPNGWYFRISEVPFFDTNGNSIEEGIAPEVKVAQKPQSTAVGRDDLIEKAIELLK